MSGDHCKVLFGVWCTFVLIVIGEIARRVHVGEGDVVLCISLALCGVVILQLYWKLWHVKRTEVRIIPMYVRDDPNDPGIKLTKTIVEEDA